MKTKGFVIWAKIEQSSSSAVKRGDAVAGCVSNPRNLDFRPLFSLRPRSERKYTNRPCAWRRCPMAIAVDVFPNPGELHMETRRVASLFTWAMTSLHSFSRPVKWGTIEGRFDFGRVGLNSAKKMTDFSSADDQMCKCKIQYSTAVSIVIKSNSPLNIIPELIWEVWLHKLTKLIVVVIQ